VTAALTPCKANIKRINLFLNPNFTRKTPPSTTYTKALTAPHITTTESTTMNDHQNHDEVGRPSSENEQGLDEMVDELDAEADQELHTVHFRPLVDFLNSHVQYVSVDDSPSQHECPICRETPSESHERMLQIDLPSCRHIFGADCFEKYIQRSHTCPMCREMWFEKRLTLETPIHQHISIEITVADQRSAQVLAHRLDSDGGEVMRRLLGERVTELDNSDEETEVPDSTAGEDTESGSDGMISLLGSSQVEARQIEVTIRAGGGSGSDTELERDDSGDGGRAREVARRSGSDDEDVAPPRQ
jgi:hypothetical protein